MDAFAVISNLDTNEKLGLGHESLKPRASILDPEYTYSVSKYQTAAGTADIMSHIFETYFTKEEYVKELGIPMNLRDVAIEEEKLSEMAKQAVRFGVDDCFVPLKEEDVLEIFKNAF